MMDEAAREKIRTEPLALSDLFSYSYRHFSNEILILLGLTAFFEFPSELLWYMMWSSFRLWQLLSFLFIWLVELAILPFILICVTSMMKQTVDSGEASQDLALQTSWNRYLPMAWVLLLEGLIVFGGTILFIVPGVIWFIDYTFAIYIVSVLPIEGKAALDYSKELVRGRWFLVFAVSLMFYLASWVPMFFAPNNMILYALMGTCFLLIAPYSLLIYGIWFLNLHYLHERAAASASPTE